MINQILQDSLTVNQTKNYHLIHLSLSEIGDIILNCNEFDKIKFLIEENKTTFKVTGKTYDKLMEFVREFQDKLDWVLISAYRKLSEDFIREFQDKVNWTNISIYQKLSEKFIREFQDKVEWNCISFHRELSEDFIREFQDKVNWFYIFRDFREQKLSKAFRKEFAHKL